MLRIASERQLLLEQHATLTQDIAGIREDIARLSRANRQLKFENQNLQRILRGKNTLKSASDRENIAKRDNSQHKLWGNVHANVTESQLPFFDSESILEALTGFGDAARGEIIKHAKNVFDDVAKRFAASDAETASVAHGCNECDHDGSQRMESNLSSDESNDDEALRYIGDDEDAVGALAAVSKSPMGAAVKHIGQYKNVSI